MKNNQKIAFFLPTRKGSERVKNKNTRPFASFDGGLMENKMRQLIETSLVDEILISTNDENCIAIASAFSDSRIKVILRPDNLCLSSTNLQDLISYVCTITDAAHILWGHVTTPFVNAADYDDGIVKYSDSLNNGYDSLVGVTELRNFLLNGDGHIVNNSTELSWPRTQDLEILYEINHTMFIASRSIYLKDKNRLGHNPYLYLMDKISSFDIDWEEDFLIAEIMYNSIVRKNGNILDERI